MAAKKSEPKPIEGSISRAGFADKVDASRVHRTFKIMPSAIAAKHSNNHDRAPLYSRAVELPELADHPAFGGEDAFCFTRAEVLARADSFTRHGQEMAVRFDRTATGLCSLSAGYLRHAAALYLEVTGKLKDCAPNGAGDKLADGLLGLAADAPKTLEGQIASVWHSAAENERKATTPIDLAWKIRRLSQLQVPMSEVCSRLGISQSTATNHLRLLTLPVATQLAVHEGKLSYVKALRDASERGEGSTTGPRSGVPVKAMRRALSQIDKRPLSLPADHGADERLYTQAEVSELLAASLALATGVHVDELPESLREVATSPTVREVITWAKDAPKPDKPPRETKPEESTPKAERPKATKAPKKAPPRAGKQEKDA